MLTIFLITSNGKWLLKYKGVQKEKGIVQKNHILQINQKSRPDMLQKTASQQTSLQSERDSTFPAVAPRNKYLAHDLLSAWVTFSQEESRRRVTTGFSPRIWFCLEFFTAHLVERMTHFGVQNKLQRFWGELLTRFCFSGKF